MVQPCAYFQPAPACGKSISVRGAFVFRLVLEHPLVSKAQSAKNAMIGRKGYRDGLMAGGCC